MPDKQWNFTLEHKPPGEAIDLLLIPKSGRTFKNSVKGVHEFIQTVSTTEHHCVLGTTGNYSALLVYQLSQASITISLENPLKIKNFARVMLTVTKTDEIDTKLIASYEEKTQPAPYKLCSDSILSSNRNGRCYAGFKKTLVATQNLKGSMEALASFDPECRKTIEKTIVFLEKQIKAMEEKLASLAQDEYKRLMDLLTSIKESVSHWPPHSSLQSADSLTLIPNRSLENFAAKVQARLFVFCRFGSRRFLIVRMTLITKQKDSDFF